MIALHSSLILVHDDQVMRFFCAQLLKHRPHVHRHVLHASRVVVLERMSEYPERWNQETVEAIKVQLTDCHNPIRKPNPQQEPDHPRNCSYIWSSLTTSWWLV